MGRPELKPRRGTAEAAEQNIPLIGEWLPTVQLELKALSPGEGKHLLVRLERNGAEGGVDLTVDPIASPWDLAAPQVIVEEAGGRFTDFAGVSRADGGRAVASNGRLHEEALAVLADPHPRVPPRTGPAVP